MEKTRITHEVREVVESHQFYDIVKYTSVAEEYVKYTDHAAEMREVLERLSWRDQDLLDKYARYLEEK